MGFFSSPSLLLTSRPGCDPRKILKPLPLEGFTSWTTKSAGGDARPLCPGATHRINLSGSRWVFTREDRWSRDQAAGCRRVRARRGWRMGARCTLPPPRSTVIDAGMRGAHGLWISFAQPLFACCYWFRGAGDRQRDAVGVCVCVHARLCVCLCVFRREVASYLFFLIKESIPGVTLATSSLGTIQSCCWTIRVLGLTGGKGSTSDSLIKCFFFYIQSGF